MKKTLLIFMVVFLLFTVACSNNEESKVIDSNNEKAAMEEEEEAELKSPIDIEGITPEVTILDPDSIGTVYMEATYTNNTEYPIVGYDLTVLLKDRNETSYLSTYDTIMPGETSPKFETFGPETRNSDDYEFLKLEVNSQIEPGKIMVWEYDFKLKKATWWEYEE